MANMPHGLCMFDAEVRLVICNARYAEMYNLPPEKVRPGTTLREIVEYRHEIGNGPLNFPDYVTSYKADVTPLGTEVGIVQLEDGRTIRVSRLSLKGGGYVATHEDVSAAVRAEAHITHLENNDALTHLPNRIQFRRSLEQHLTSRASEEQVAVLCLDIDHFKAINDTLGHPVGDALLMAVALRLQECAGTDGTVARLSGDEFGCRSAWNNQLAQPASPRQS
jgi:predicted signal transduction protein with EAL and GGDEF domain